MPVRSRGKLLAGMAGLLGLCTAGAGCQSSGANSDCYAIRCDSGGGGTGGGTASAGTVAFRPVNPQGRARRSVFDRLRRPAEVEPALASTLPPEGRQPVAVMLRPVPAGGTTPP